MTTGFTLGGGITISGGVTIAGVSGGGGGGAPAATNLGSITVGTAHVAADSMMMTPAYDYYGFTNDSVVNGGVPFGSATAPTTGSSPTRLYLSTRYGAGSTTLKLQSGTYDGFSVGGMGEITGHDTIYLTVGGVTATFARNGTAPYSYSASTDPLSLASKVGQTVTVAVTF